MAKILVIDDEKQIRRVIELQLSKAGHEIILCANGKEGLDKLADCDFDLIITDLRMPKVTGIELLKELRDRKSKTPVIVTTAFGSVETAVEAMKLGAVDYLTKPLQLLELSLRVDGIFSKVQLIEENKRLRKELVGKFQMGKIVGRSPAMQRVVKQLRPLSNDGNISILLTGESGTGKELVANAIHYNSPRVEESFVAINCAALPDHLLESELFGHEKGAFTDAKELKKGLFEVADRGTLFLDEIASMPMNIQAKLLRAIEEGEIRRVGGTKNIPIDVRFIAASNSDLEKLVEKEEFRQDLYFRLAVATVKLPALRNRDGDIRLLTQHFLEGYNHEKDRDISLAPEVFRLLEKHSWQGNVRELENLVELLVVTSSEERVFIADLPENIGSSSNQRDDFFEVGQNLKAASRGFERAFITKYLGENDGNISKTARVIGISRSALHVKIKDLEIG